MGLAVGHLVRLDYAGVLGPLVVASMMGLAPPAGVDVIQWNAQAPCPDDAAVEARIATYVDVAAASAPTQATVRQTADHFEVELVSTIDGEEQRRTLTAPTCETLAEAVAVVVALTIDPEGASPPVDDEVVPPAVAAAVVVVPATPVTTTRGERDEPPVAPLPARRPFEIGLRLGGGYGSAVAPVGSGIVGGALSLGRKPWSVELEGRLWIPRSFDEPDGRYGATVTLGTGAVIGCLRPPTRAVEIPLCFGIEAGSQRAKPQGLGLEDQATRNYPWVAPLLRAGLRLRFADTVGLLLLVEGAVPLVKAGINVGGDPQLWATQAFSFRALAGFDIRWVR